LQVGRVAMEERLAFTVTTLASLKSRLQAFIAEPIKQNAWSRGSVRPGNEAWSAFARDEELQEAVHKWLKRGKYEKLLDLWVKGLTVDWHQLYADGQHVQRISLPSYPFAKERHWFDVEPQSAATRAGSSASRLHSQLHPLIHQNNSTAFELTFSSRFDGS